MLWLREMRSLGCVISGRDVFSVAHLHTLVVRLVFYQLRGRKQHRLAVRCLSFVLTLSRVPLDSAISLGTLGLAFAAPTLFCLST